MPKYITLMCDYNCYPLWWSHQSGRAGDINPELLPLKENTIKRLITWSDIYDDTLNKEDPRQSGFKAEQDRLSFELEGLELWSILREELGDEYIISYHSQEHHTDLVHPKDLKQNG